MPKKKIAPVHPGVFIAELLQELGLSQAQLAKHIHVSPMRINHVINERRPVTAELALRLGQYFKQSPRYWLNLQARYDLDLAEDQHASLIARQVHPYSAVA